MCSDVLVWPIWLLYQKAFDNSKLPPTLKRSKVVPVHKKGDKTQISNYRVIAIDAVILKIFEIAIKSKLMLIIEPLLSNSQHGFRPKRSVTTNLMNLSVTVHEAFTIGKQVDVFYGDFRSAFDKVWHKKLIEKLSHFKIGIKTAKLLTELITGRQYFVKIGDNKSNTYCGYSGVVPGSVLGPIFFLIFINDLPNIINHSNVLMFADDIKLYKVLRKNEDASLLQTDINRLIDWCYCCYFHGYQNEKIN